jgi:hypothetical protein
MVDSKSVLCNLATFVFNLMARKDSGGEKKIFFIKSKKVKTKIN